MIQDGMEYYRAAPWLVLYPGIAITLAVVSFNLVASGLREAMDPTQRGR
jgi:peptide/nickel transport system permease protein